MHTATTAQIATAIEIISTGRPSRAYVAMALRAAGATHGQADDAIRAARHAVKFSTTWLRD